MGAVAVLILELVASEAWEAIKRQLRRPEPSWAESAADRLAQRLPGALSTRDREALARWLERGDVFASVVAATESEFDDVADQLVASLEHELGRPSSATKSVAAELVIEVLTHVTEVVDPDLAVTITT